MSEQPSSPSIEYLQLITQHQAGLLAFIRSLVPASNQIEDILQETNLILWQKSHTFTLGTNFKAFACQIARYKVLEHCRQHKKEQWLAFDESYHQKELPDEHLALLQDQRQNALRRCLNRLTDPDRRLLQARYEEGKTIRDLSKQSTASESALQQRFHRLRQRLKQCIESHGQSQDLDGTPAPTS